MRIASKYRCFITDDGFGDGAFRFIERDSRCSSSSSCDVVERSTSVTGIGNYRCKNADDE